MPSYYLIQQKDLETHLPQGEDVTRLGFLDFLRELQQDDFALTPYRHVIVEGIEDVLLAARPNVADIAHNIRRVFQVHASDLQEKLVANVYIVFRNPLERGESLWVNTPAEHELPIHLIFGSPPKKDLDGKPYFVVSFNLSSGL